MRLFLAPLRLGEVIVSRRIDAEWSGG
jgi:hypothetical protein